MRRASSLVCLLLLGAVLNPSSVIAKSENLGGWSPAAPMTTGRAQHTATLLRTGRVLVTGGVDARGVTSATAELFDPSVNRWSEAAPMSEPRTQHAATLLNDGRVLVVGGFHGRDLDGETVPTAEIYDPRTNRWMAAAPMTRRRAGHSATLLPDGRVLVLGGIDITMDPHWTTTYPDQGELYDPMTDRWSETAPGMGGRQGHTATLLLDGRVLLMGGQGDQGLQQGATLYDPTQNSWVAAAPPVVLRRSHSATALPDGRVLILGGDGASAAEVAQLPNRYGSEPLSSGALYDPTHNLWTPILAMHATRLAHTATALRDGTILVVGGAYANPGHPEIYEVAANHWVQATAVINRHAHTATLLHDGRVLIVGGFGIDAMSTAWTYGPDTGVAQVSRWAPVPIALALLAALGILLALIWGGRLCVSLRKRLRQDDPDQWIAS
jgi:N-acetylneuraminic acid mutarotase